MLCTKNYENPSIFVKVTVEKSVAPFYVDTDQHKHIHTPYSIPSGPPGHRVAVNSAEASFELQSIALARWNGERMGVFPSVGDMRLLALRFV